MERYGIKVDRALGISIPVLRRLAKEVGRDHAIAGELWRSGYHEARILASMVDDPARVTAAQMDRWARDFDSWDICDQTCMNLFDRTPFAWEKVDRWAGDGREFVKRAGFALIACLAWHDKQSPDERFLPLFALIEREADDERNFVKKAVNWALRQVGKRSRYLNGEAVAVARRIAARESRAARWIAKDALRELTDDKTLARLKR